MARRSNRKKTLPTPAAPTDPIREKAWRAVQQFNRMTPTLNSFVRSLTGDKRVRVCAGKATQTDGKTIWIRPPLALGEEIQHDRILCDERGEDRIALCPACARDDHVWKKLHHELAHHLGKSFEAPSAIVLEEFMKLIDEWHPVEACSHSAAIKKKAQYAPEYLTMFGAFHTYLVLLSQATDDARIDSGMLNIKPGLRDQFYAYTYNTFGKGVEQDDGTLMRWFDMPINAQITVGVMLVGEGYFLEPGWLRPEVIEFLHDPELQSIISNAYSWSDVHTGALKTIEAFRRLNNMGLLEVDKCVVVPPPPPTPPSLNNPSDDAPENEDADESPDESDEDQSGDSDAGDSDSSGESGEPESNDGSGNDDGDPTGDGSPGDTASSGAFGDDFENEDSGSDGDDREGGDSDDQSSEDSVPGDQEPGSSDGDDDSGSESRNSDSDPGEAEREADADPIDSDGPDDETEGPVEDDSERGSDAGDESEASEPGTGGVKSAPVGDGDSDGESDPEPEGTEPGHDSTDGDTGSVEDASVEDASGAASGSSDDDDRDEDLEEDDGPVGEEVWDDEYDEDELKAARSIPVEDLGTPEEVERILATLHPHEDPDEDMQNTANDSDDPYEEEQLLLAIERALDSAVMQAQFFDRASQEIGGVAELTYPQAHMRWNNPWGAVDFKELIPSESTIGTALMKARIVFAENKRSGYERHLRSGKVDGRVLGRRAGLKDDRLFKHRHVPAKRDYVVGITLDCSGSNAGGTKMKRAKRAVFAKAEMLNRLGIKFYITAHTGGLQRWFDSYSMAKPGEMHDLMVLWVKKIDDPWNDETRTKLAAIQPMLENYDGHTLEFHRKLLEARTETDKILIYYTDGAMPAANYDEEVVILEDEIRQCKNKKIKLLAVGINTSSPERYGFDTVQVDSDEDLIKVVEQLEHQLLT